MALDRSPRLPDDRVRVVFFLVRLRTYTVHTLVVCANFLLSDGWSRFGCMFPALRVARSRGGEGVPEDFCIARRLRLRGRLEHNILFAMALPAKCTRFIPSCCKSATNSDVMVGKRPPRNNATVWGEETVTESPGDDARADYGSARTCQEFDCQARNTEGFQETANRRLLTLEQLATMSLLSCHVLRHRARRVLWMASHHVARCSNACNASQVFYGGAMRAQWGQVRRA